ncbi:uncharacterized protein DSM5745_05530 [Aspergillus mulundensis]|uniref:Uncharacterized protein n=1 Tax=Aspergillus mulundensis TaxID=1810919 RepID=A0A3D8RXF2_9EURO|nr:hypothetical protein DSM5745_05530 [Aspergillus mulundensis]RDW78678.1 hypothetical protein DSM5745_05530 [Aspergillus mulundensis]
MSQINGQRRATDSFRTQGEDGGKNILCDQIKEIVAALNDIRSQLAEQNKYLDVLTETYVRRPRAATVPSRKPAPFTFADELETVEWEDGSDWGDHIEYVQEEAEQPKPEEDDVFERQDDVFGWGEGIRHEMYEHRLEQEEFHQEEQDEPEEEVFEDARDEIQDPVYDAALATQLMESLEEAIPVKMIEKQQPTHLFVDSTTPGSTPFYLPLGLVIVIAPLHALLQLQANNACLSNPASVIRYDVHCPVAGGIHLRDLYAVVPARGRLGEAGYWVVEAREPDVELELKPAGSESGFEIAGFIAAEEGARDVFIGEEGSIRWMENDNAMTYGYTNMNVI